MGGQKVVVCVHASGSKGCVFFCSPRGTSTGDVRLSWLSQRFVWTRLPQGFVWAGNLFSERISEVLRGSDSVQYVDDILIGASSPTELRRKSIKIFQSLSEFGLKVNMAKTEFCTSKVSFLGIEIEDGQWSLKRYF